MNPFLRVTLRILGIGALVAGGLAVALAALVAVILLGPLLFWIAWNVLDFGHALSLPELGFWGIVLATLFLVVGWLGRVRWPEPTFRNFLAVALVALLASRPHAHAHDRSRRAKG